MTTIATLVESRKLIRWELNSDHPKFPVRDLCLSPQMDQWMEDLLPYLKVDRGGQTTPLEQVETMFDDYVSLERFTGIGCFVRIEPHPSGVYEIKTVDVRVFGWFWRAQKFIAHTADMKKNLKHTDKIAQIRKNTVSYREGLRLDPPPFITNQSITSLL